MAEVINLPDNIYKRILTSIGYPVVSEEDVGLTKDDIVDLFVLPPLKNVYFKWFPKKEESAYKISTTFSVDFPDEYTFGVTDLRLNSQPYYAAEKTSNPLINEINIREASGFGRNMWDSGNDYGFSEVDYSQRALRQSIVDTYKGFKKTIDYQNRKITGYTNVTGSLSITWAKYSNDWNDINFRFEEDLIKLCQSYLLQFLGQLRSQENTNMADELDGGDFIDRAETLYKEVMEAWKNYPRVTILR